MTPELALQKAIRSLLGSSTSVTGLVPLEAILDRNERPVPDPSVIIGEGQSIDEGDTLNRDRTHVYLDLHIWKKEPSTVGVKTIAGAIRNALRASRPQLDSGFHCADCHVSSSRFLRDQDGLTSHGVVTVEAIIQETAGV